MTKRRIVGSLLLMALALALLFWTGGGRPGDTVWQPQELELTAAERQWLNDHPVIRVGVDEHYLPIEAYDERGQLIGISAEYLAILERQLRVKIEVAHGLSWSQVLEGARNGQIDMLCSLAQSPERETYMLFGETYLRYPVVVVTRDTLKNINSVDDLRGRPIAAVKDYWVYDLSRLVYPFLHWRYYETESDCLKAVAQGAVDAYITDSATSSYQIEQLELENLRIALETPYFWEGRIAVRKDWPELAAIVNKGLAAIPQSERTRINDKWLNAKAKSWWQNRQVQLAGASAFAIVLLLLTATFVWNRSLRRQVARQTEELRNANESLEYKVRLRTIDLTAANRELQDSNEKLGGALEQLQQTQKQLLQSEKMASLNTIVAGVAHEINTPIGSGVTMASLLLEQAEELERSFAQNSLTRGELEEFLKRQHEAAELLLVNLQRAAEMVKSFKRLSADQASEVRRLFAVRQCLEDVVASLRAHFKNTRHQIVLDCAEDWLLESYPGALSQLTANLLLNSLSHAYGPQDKGVITIQIRPAGDEIVYEYRDDGRGIAEEALDHIFDPFYTTNRSGGNTGLGLYVLYHLAQQTFGGTLRCESRPGEGVRFTLRFPALRNTANENKSENFEKES